jgi:hypothetical protein
MRRDWKIGSAVLPLVALFVLSLGACVPAAPTPGPEARCADACVTQAQGCTAAQCARGCVFILDKLVELEGARVLACVARATKAHSTGTCDDATFAGCAARTGPFVDGGPPPPAPPSSDDDES